MFRFGVGLLFIRRNWHWRAYDTQWVGLGVWGRCRSYVRENCINARQTRAYHRHAKVNFVSIARFSVCTIWCTIFTHFQGKLTPGFILGWGGLQQRALETNMIPNCFIYTTFNFKFCIFFTYTVQSTNIYTLTDINIRHMKHNNGDMLHASIQNTFMATSMHYCIF